MTRLSRLPPRDLEALSAYADGRLSPAERKRIEGRLREDPALRRALDEIRATSALLRALPSVRPPRNFLLTPEMAGVRRRWLGYPALQLVTAMATLAFFVTVGLDAFAPAAAPTAFRAAAPSQGLALEAPAQPSALPTEAAAAVPALGAQLDAAATALPESTATAVPPPSDYANRELPGVGGGGELPPAPLEAGTPPPSAPLLESGAATLPSCEACAGDQLLPPGTPNQKSAVEVATPEGEGVTPEAFALQAQARAEPTAEIPSPAGLPFVRWLEIGLAAAALAFGGLSVWARRKAG